MKKINLQDYKLEKKELLKKKRKKGRPLLEKERYDKALTINVTATMHKQLKKHSGDISLMRFVRKILKKSIKELENGKNN